MIYIFYWLINYHPEENLHNALWLCPPPAPSVSPCISLLLWPQLEGLLCQQICIGRSPKSSTESLSLHRPLSRLKGHLIIRTSCYCPFETLVHMNLQGNNSSYFGPTQSTKKTLSRLLWNTWPIELLLRQGHCYTLTDSNGLCHWSLFLPPCYASTKPPPVNRRRRLTAWPTHCLPSRVGVQGPSCDTIEQMSIYCWMLVPHGVQLIT